MYIRRKYSTYFELRQILLHNSRLVCWEHLRYYFTSTVLHFQGCATVTTAIPSKWLPRKGHSCLTSSHGPVDCPRFTSFKLGQVKPFPRMFLDWNWESRSLFFVGRRYNRKTGEPWWLCLTFCGAKEKG